MRQPLLFILTISFVFFWAHEIYARFDPFLGGAVERLDAPVVLELYTSQSCSSCPAADQLMEQVSSASDEVIALGFHVDYWNHLHWKDTLSHDFASDRQRAYASARNSRRVYTPQVIVNGEHDFVGSNAGKFKNALQGAKDIKRAELSFDAEGALVIYVPEMDRRISDAQFWLFGTKDKHVQTMSAGENRGRTVTYTNSVMFEKNLGMHSGEFKPLTVSVPESAAYDRLVVLVQQGAYGDVIAAGAVRR